MCAGITVSKSTSLFKPNSCTWLLLACKFYSIRIYHWPIHFSLYTIVNQYIVCLNIVLTHFQQFFSNVMSSRFYWARKLEHQVKCSDLWQMTNLNRLTIKVKCKYIMIQHWTIFFLSAAIRDS